MAESAIREKLKALVDERDNTVLDTFLDIAKDRVLLKLYPFDATKTAVPARYISTQVQIAAYLINKRGAEGETVHDENGIRRTYEKAYVPPSLLDAVVPYASTF